MVALCRIKGKVQTFLLKIRKFGPRASKIASKTQNCGKTRPIGGKDFSYVTPIRVKSGKLFQTTFISFCAIVSYWCCEISGLVVDMII